ASAFSLKLPTPFDIAAAFHLDLGAETLRRAPQLSIPVLPGLPAGTEVVFYRAGVAFDSAGVSRPVWYQVDIGAIGADGLAHSGTNPIHSGALQTGDYVVAFAPTGTTGHVHGQIVLANPLARNSLGFIVSATLPAASSGHPLRAAHALNSQPMLDPAPTIDDVQILIDLSRDLILAADANPIALGVATYIAQISFDILLITARQTIQLTEILSDAPSITTPAGVLVSASAPATFTTTINNSTLPPGSPANPPQIDSAGFEFAMI